ncbi:MAG TPA: TonB-dependent receptor plug domain-containing protein, partial [Oceanipulchritudo sp.]|nr:TonB-dependent receptor plug domain-containing protein [Oceanipulchritudo sp.]
MLPFPATHVLAQEEDVFNLDPFEVSVQDTNYVPQSSVVASGFAIENVKNPISISSLSERFVDDLKFDDLGEAAPYLSGTSKSGSPPSHGTMFRVRGFGTSWSTRNGVTRYVINGTDNLDRLEIVKGPAAVFFGQASPGGVVNYVTKRASFTPVTSFETRYGSYDYMRVEVEAQGPLFNSEKFAYRINSSYLDKEDWRDFEYQERSYVFGGILFQPVKQLKFYAEYERIRDKANEATSVPQGNPNWMRGFLALTEPGNAVADYYATHPTEIGLGANATREEVIGRLQGRWRANREGTNARWQTDTARALGIDPETLPTEAEIVPEATPYGWRWNSFGRSGFYDSDLENITLESTWAVTDWFTLRGLAVWDNLYRGDFSAYGHRFEMRPEGPSFVGTKLNLGNLGNESRTLSVNGVLRFDTGPLDSTVLFGYDEFQDKFLRAGWEDNSTPDSIPAWSYWEDGYPEQDFGDSSFLYDGLNHISTRTSSYANYVGRLWDERLVVMMGIRDQRFIRENPSGDENLRTRDINEQTPSFGAVLEIFDGINLFGSMSESFNASSGVSTVQINSNLSFEEQERFEDLLGLEALSPLSRRGKGWDIGLKSNWNEGMISGTISYYQVEETNLYSEFDLEGTLNDPLNAEYLQENPDAQANQLPVLRYTPFGVSSGEGIEADVIFQPSPDMSFVFSYTHYFKAEVDRGYGEKLRVRGVPLDRFSV